MMGKVCTSGKDDTPHGVARNGRVELRRPSLAGPIHLFAQGAVSAVMQGEVIIVTLKDGRLAEYKLSTSGNAVIQTRNIWGR
jgi:hypothetical protein